MKYGPRRMLLVSLFLGCALSMQGQTKAGGIPIRIPNAPDARCINGKTDQVWLTLYRVIMTKKGGWFTTSKQAEIVITVTVKTKPPSTQTLSYPLSSKVNIRDYQVGQVSIPVEYTLVSGLELKQKDAAQKVVLYTGFGIDTTVINVRSESALGSTLSALGDLTGNKKLPIPDSPYTQAAGYILEFANNAVSNAIKDQNADDKYTSASLALNFDPTGTCGDVGPDGLGFETTGTKAILMGEGVQGEGYVPIDQTGSYCWTADVTPVFVLKATKKLPSKPCSDPSYTAAYKPVTNNYIAYFLQKRSISGRLGGEQVEVDMKESKQLCDVLGVVDCSGARP